MRNMKNMPYIIGLKMRIYPSDKQKSMIRINSDAFRFVYNKLVGRNKELYRLRKVTLYCEPLQNRIAYLSSLGTKGTDFQSAYPFLQDKRIDSLCIANAVMNYSAAWNNYKKNPVSKVPTFHKKSYSQTYQTNAQYTKGVTDINKGSVHLTDKDHIQLPKLGRIRFSCSDRLYDIFSRNCETRIGTIKIQMNNCGEYYASLQIGSVEPFFLPTKKTGRSIGIDVNIKNLYTDSEGNEVENRKYRSGIQHKLSKAQRKLSRRMLINKAAGRDLRSCKNYQAQRLKVARLLSHVTNQKLDSYNVLTKRLVESQDTIFAEDIKAKNLLKNHKLAYAIADVS